MVWPSFPTPQLSLRIQARLLTHQELHVHQEEEELHTRVYRLMSRAIMQNWALSRSRQRVVDGHGIARNVPLPSLTVHTTAAHAIAVS